MSRDMLGLSTLVGIAFFVLYSNTVHAQSSMTSQEAREMRKFGATMIELQRLSTDAKLAEELNITADQKTKIQIVTQKFADVLMNMQRSNEGGKIDMKQYRRQAEDLMLDVRKILTAKQADKLSELSKEREKMRHTNIPTQQNMHEMQRLTALMTELQRLSYDAQLAEKLELTVEQRVLIREASQKFARAMQERANASNGQPFDLNRYTQMMGDLMHEAQAILTPEQAEQLSRTAKLKQLKQRHGDEFAMIIGLAEDFDLNANQKRKLHEEINEAREVYYAKLNELKEVTLQRIAGELPREHREEVREAVSGFFDVDLKKNQSAYRYEGSR